MDDADRNERIMTGTGQLVSVRRVDGDGTECRRCGQPIEPGRRVAFVTGTGNVCLRCLLAQRTLVGADQTAQADDQTAHDQTSAADVAAAQPRRND